MKKIISTLLILWSVCINAQTNYYWNGAAPTGTTASGGTGNWNTTTTNWLTAPTAGTVKAWPNTNAYVANFGSPAGTVTLSTTPLTAANAVFSVTGYTLTPPAATAQTFTSNITLGSSVQLTLMPNETKTITYSGSISGGTGSSLVLSGTSLTGSNNQCYLSLALVSSSITVPAVDINLGTTNNTNVVGIAGKASGITMSSNIVLSGTVGDCRAALGTASSGTLNISGQISGTGDISFGSGSSGGTGTLTLSNTGNNFTGNVYMVSGANGVFQASAGGSSCVPSTMAVYYALAAQGGVFDINGSNVTIAGLSQPAATAVGSITNGGSAAGTLIINQPAATTTSFGLAITNGAASAAKTALTLGAAANTSSLTLTSTSNTFSGGLTLNADGNLITGAANVLVATLPVVLNGGQLSTGITTSSTGYSQSVSTLQLTGNSTIQLGTGTHTLNFADSHTTTWTGGTTLTITGWQGTAGGSGTNGKIIFGSSNSALTTGQLAQITFAGYTPGAAQILSTGEIVPLSSTLTASLSTVSPTVGSELAGTTYTITVTTPSNVTINSSVNYAITGIQATQIASGSLTGTLTIPAGSNTASTGITVQNDNIFEGSETGTVAISSPTGNIATASSGTVSFTLNDDATFYWNGGTPANNPATGGTGNWITANAWIAPVNNGNGTAETWQNGYAAVFGGTAGTVTLPASAISATSSTFSTTGYTLTASGSETFNSPISLGTGVDLNLIPDLNATLTQNGNITGGTNLNLSGAGFSTSGNVCELSLSTANTTISVPNININLAAVSNSNLVGIVGKNTGVTIPANITFNGTANEDRVMLCATSGNSMDITGQITGTGDIQFSSGSTGGAGTLTLANTGNSFAGNLYLAAAAGGIFQASAGAGSCVPPAMGVYYSTASQGGIFDINGSDVTIAALSQTKNSAVGSITNGGISGANTLTINQSASTTFGPLIITDGTTAKTAVAKSGTGTLTLSGTNTFTGGLTLNAGLVQMGAVANLLANNLPFTFNGGTFGTGAITGYNEAVGTILLTDNSSINLGTGSHALKFNNSSALSWTTGKTLTINGWIGTAGNSGTDGQIFVGTDNTGLTATQLAQITFSGSNPGATILSTGEIVPASESLTVDQTGFNGAFGNIDLGSLSSPQSFTVSGSSLNTTVAITAPTGFLLSLTSGSGYSTSPITLNTTGGILSTTTIYVEFVPVTSGAASGNITVVSGSNTKNVAVSGTGVVTTVYSQASGAAATGTIWSYLPLGTPQTITALGGFSNTTNIVIQNGHTVTISANLTINNLTINSGGVLKELVSSTSTPYYINLYGNLTVDGQLGALAGVDSLALNIDGTSQIIQGSGNINLQRIRNNIGTASLTVSANINLWYTGAAVYNNTASSTFNVTLSANNTMNFEGIGDISINGAAGATANRGGIYTVNGTMTGLDTVYGFASATAYSTSEFIIDNGGIMSANFVKAGIGGTGNFNFAVNSGGELDINKVLQLQLGSFAPVGKVVMKSTSISQVAIIDNFSSAAFTGTYSGQITAERYYEAANVYTQQHEMGSPVNGPSLAQFGAGSTSGYIIPGSGCNQLNAAPNSPYGNVFSYHENAPGAASCGMAQWYVEPSTNTATNGVGYSVLMPGPATLSLTGTPNLNTTYTVTGLKNSAWSNSTLQGNPIKSGWQLVANPYLASLNISSAPSGFDSQILVWVTNGIGSGSYETLMAGSNALIAPFQSFLVHVSNGNTGSYTYTIKASDRTTNAQAFYMQNDNELDLSATNLETGLTDKTIVAFNTNATDTFDTQFDANKSAGALNRQTLYSVNNGDWMSINTLHDIATASTVPVGFEPGRTGNYSLSFGDVNTFDPSTYIYLEDLQQHIIYNARNGNYQFSADSADGWNRFVLHFTPPVVIASTDADCNSLGAINVTQPGTATWNYTITNDNNAIVASGILNQTTPININQSAGTYTLTLVDNDNYTVTKVIHVNGAQGVTAAFSPSTTSVTTQTQVSFVNTSQDANTFSWNFGDGITSNLVSPVHTYAMPGNYLVELTALNTTGCTSTTSEIIKVTNSTTGITPVSENKITMWSNTNRIYIDFTQLDVVDAKIKVYDVLGQELMNEEFNTSTLYEKEIDNTNAACIIVSVKNGDKITTQKLFISSLKPPAMQVVMER